MSEPVAVTDATFEEEVLRAQGPVLVDFWAEWCGPCKALAPFVHEVAAEQVGKLKVTKLDVDGNMGTARQYRVTSIPTLLLFKDGQVVERLSGFRSKDALMKTLAPHLETAAK